MANSAKKFYADHCSPASDFGDMSIRNPETGYIYAYPNTKSGFQLYRWDKLRSENIAVIDSDGNLVEIE